MKNDPASERRYWRGILVQGLGALLLLGASAPPASPQATRLEGKAILGAGGWPTTLTGAVLVLRAGPKEERVPIDWSDGSWSAELAPGNWTLLVDLGDETLETRPATLSVGTEEARVADVEVLPRPAVRGRLVTCDGTAITGARVRLRDPDSGSTTTDEQGFFVLGLLRSRGPVEVRVDETTLPAGIQPPWWQWDGVQAVAREHYFETGIGIPVRTLVLSTATALTGKVTGPDGAPLRHATLSIRMRSDPATYAQGANFVVTTDGVGVFEGRFAPGTYEAWCFAREFGEGTARPDPVQGIEVVCGSARQTRDLVFDQGLGSARIEGRVVDPDGHPVPDVMLRIDHLTPGKSATNYAMYSAKAGGRSDGDGRVRIEGLAEGRYLVARYSSHEDPRVLIDAQGPLEIDVGPEGGAFQWTVNAFRAGSIRGRSGDGSERVRVWLEMPLWDLRREVTTDREGRFVFDRLPPGEVTLGVRPVRGAEGSSTTARLEEGEELTVEL